MKSKDEFELAYRRAMDKDGSSYDPWDLAFAWTQYQENPEEYGWVFEADEPEVTTP